MRLTIIGLGQTLRGDDAAGIEALQTWQQAFPESAARSNVGVQYSELPGLALIDLLHGFDAAILVDAVNSAAPPGTVHRLDATDLKGFAPGSISAHGWGVAETLELAEQLQPPGPQVRIRLVGIEGHCMELGASMSAAVRDALPIAARAIQAEVEALLA